MLLRLDERIIIINIINSIVTIIIIIIFIIIDNPLLQLSREVVGTRL